MYLFPGPRPKKKSLSSYGFTKTVTVRLRSIVPKRPTAHGLLRSFVSTVGLSCLASRTDLPRRNPRADLGNCFKSLRPRHGPRFYTDAALRAEAANVRYNEVRK